LNYLKEKKRPRKTFLCVFSAMVTRNCNNLHTLHLRLYQLEWYSSTFPPLQPRKTDRKGNTYNMASSSSTSLYRDKTFASIRDFTQVNTRDNRRHNIPKEKGKAERLKSAAGPLACFTNKTKKRGKKYKKKAPGRNFNVSQKLVMYFLCGSFFHREENKSRFCFSGGKRIVNDKIKTSRGSHSLMRWRRESRSKKQHDRFQNNVTVYFKKENKEILFFPTWPQLLWVSEECLTRTLSVWKMSCWPVRFNFIFLNSAPVFFLFISVVTHNWKGTQREKKKKKKKKRVLG
jgi:hypothetical protein